LGPIPNPQSPIPNPQSPIPIKDNKINKLDTIKINNKIIKNKYIIKWVIYAIKIKIKIKKYHI